MKISSQEIELEGPDDFGHDALGVDDDLTKMHAGNEIRLATWKISAMAFKSARPCVLIELEIETAEM